MLIHQYQVLVSQQYASPMQLHEQGDEHWFLDLAVAKSLQSTRTVTDAADDADVLTTTGYTC